MKNSNEPRLKLSDLLRRRKMTLQQFVADHSITTYEGLVIRCAQMGVAAPEETVAREGLPKKAVNNPPEGVVVVEPTELASEKSEEEIVVVHAPKKARKKKEAVVTTEPVDEQEDS